MAWERSFNASLGRTAALLLGDWRRLIEHATQLPELVQEAKARGDVPALHFLSTFAWQMRARAAVAMVAVDGGGQRRYLREAVRSAGQIERRRWRWARGVALLIRASVASVTQERQATSGVWSSRARSA